MIDDESVGELEVRLMNLEELHKDCPYRFHNEPLLDYCYLQKRLDDGITEPCPNQSNGRGLVDGNTFYPKCDYLINHIDLEYEIYKCKKGL